MRQVAIPKQGGTLYPDGSGRLADLRPVTVESVVWRMIASAIARNDECREWQEKWRPRSMFWRRSGTLDGALGPQVGRSVRRHS